MRRIGQVVPTSGSSASASSDAKSHLLFPSIWHLSGRNPRNEMAPPQGSPATGPVPGTDPTKVTVGERASLCSVPG
jgi:hypothetical protein